MDWYKNDEYFMKHALRLASNGSGRTSPNPVVGAVIVKDGSIVGRGWHQKAGTPHAEIHALNDAGELAAGATLYVTLEPCCHYGRTAPCTEAIIRAGIKRVVFAMSDPNPCVSGSGGDQLRQAGISVSEGILAGDAANLNEVFIKWIATGMPFGVLKTAMTLDGKIATRTGHSQWITGAAARKRVHELRDRYDAILVGIGTVLADDPQLTTRLPQGGKNPVRIILDGMARTPLTAKVVSDGAAHTIIAVSSQAPPARIAALQASGVEVLVVGVNEDGIDLRKLFYLLGKREITSVFIEGGATVNSAALKSGVVDLVYWFIAPKIIGGRVAPGPVGGSGISRLEAAIELEDTCVEWIGQDLLIKGHVAKREGRNVYRACGRIGDSEKHCPEQ